MLEKVRGKKLYLFGAGIGGSRAGQILLENGICEFEFVDNNKQKQGSMFCNKKVISPEMLAEKYGEEKKTYVIITAGEGSIMMRQLLELGINKEDISIFDTSQIFDCHDNLKFIEKNKEELLKVFSLLSDEYSKKVFWGLLNYRLTLNFNELKDIYEPDNEQYFDKKIIKFQGNEVFVDAGTYDGLTVKEYLNKCHEKYGKIICFEVDKNNISVVKENFIKWKIDYVQIYELGLWSKNTILKFDAIGSGSGRISEEGTVSVKVNTLDEILKNQKVDFIKMDIEGAEVEALKGAKKIIREQRPKLAISVYHKPEDIFLIPLLIHNMCSEYKLYLRHYRQFSAQETICYAI